MKPAVPISARVMFERLELRQACEEAMVEVNQRIAPAELYGWDFDRYDDNVLEFFAKWGLVRFSVFIETISLLHTPAGQEKANVVSQIMRVAPNAMANTIGRIAIDAVQQHTSLLNSRVDAVEGRLTAIEIAASDREEAASDASDRRRKLTELSVDIWHRLFARGAR
ncbi:MAG: hypothetical protein JWL97_2946 [Gemmatimonadales bacterium]|nr:hypothetical protein [Gemmatimonadales bacterium]